MTESATNTPSTALSGSDAPGQFVWYDLMTTDLPRAREFYQAMFGWRSESMPIGPDEYYDMLYAGEYGIGGMMKLDPAAGGTPQWIPYISVGDVDGAAATASAAGARIHVPPTDIPNVGRFSMIEDPAGAVFSAFRRTGAPDAQPAVGTPGTFAWTELMTPEPQKAAEFYGRLTGWGVESMDMGELGTYWVLKRGDVNAAGMAELAPTDSARPHWQPAIAVESCDAAVARAAELGATVIVPPADLEDWGRFAVALDPTGAVFTILENKRPM